MRRAGLLVCFRGCTRTTSSPARALACARSPHRQPRRAMWTAGKVDSGRRSGSGLDGPVLPDGTDAPYDVRPQVRVSAEALPKPAVAPAGTVIDERRLERHRLQVLGSTSIARVRTEPFHYTRRATTLPTLLTRFSIRPSSGGVREPNRHAPQLGADGYAAVGLEP